MKISNSNINMYATSFFSKQKKSEEISRVRIGDRVMELQSIQSTGQKVSRTGARFQEQPEADMVQLSVQSQNNIQKEQLKVSVQAKATQAQMSVSKSDAAFQDIDAADSKEIQIIEKTLAALMGKKIKLRSIPSKKLKELNNLFGLGKTARDISNMSIKLSPAQQESQGVQEMHTMRQTYSEAEKLAFKADGIVKTEDGKEINFSVQLNMSREFASEQNIDLQVQQRQIDPLIINVDSNGVGLTKTKYSFDIDSDGEEEQLSFAGSGSGFLALDSNENGKIDSGKELFGPKSGNGFTELAQYDGDKNNWIDENDAIYNKLRIWMKDEQGSDRLIALGQVGIGAIYLRNLDTQFNINDENNQMQGKIMNSGILLKENGEAGIIQHIDLAI